MDTYERKQKILEILRHDGRVKVSDLSRMFGISEVTVRTDLADLEAQDLLSRVHGGAISAYKNYYNMSLQQRLSTNPQEKKAIAKRAAAMIEENDTVFFNSGATTLTVFREISPQKNLNIVTNSLEIALEASGAPNFNLVLLGGAIDPKHRFIYGDDANEQLKKYHADKLFLSVDGITTDGGLTTYCDREAELDRIMIKNAASKVIVADATKIGRTAFVRIAEVNEADYIITNDAAGVDEDIDYIREMVENTIIVKGEQ